MKLLSLSIFGLLGFFLIVLLCVKLNGSIIENELTQQAHQALAKHGLNRMTATADGQILTLKGTAINHDDRLQAESIVQSIEGITEVNNQLTLVTRNGNDDAASVAETVDQNNTAKTPEPLTESNGSSDSIAPLTPMVSIEPIPPITPETAIVPEIPVALEIPIVFEAPITPETPIEPQAPVRVDVSTPIAPQPPIPLEAPIAPVVPIAPEALFQPIIPMPAN